MAQTTLMKQGLEAILVPPENQFKSEADYGKWILKVAWTVEILAALTGLFIAWGQGYDVYNSIDNPTSSDLLGAIMGALPFVIIAVIEPTKIPLAGGFYKAKAFGWRMLILASLLGLTIVTFETMFNGLERNLTNVTRQVVDANNKILFLKNSIDEKNRELTNLENERPDTTTAGITKTLENQKRDFNDFISAESKSVEEQTKSNREDRQKLQEQRSRLAGQLDDEGKAGIDSLKEQIKGLESQILSIEKKTEKKIADYRESLRSEGAQSEKNKNSQIAQLKNQKNEKTSEITQLRNATTAAENKVNGDLLAIQQRLDLTVSAIDKEMAEALKGKILGRGSIENRFTERKERAISNSDSSKRRLNNNFDTLKKANDSRISVLNTDIQSIDKKLSAITSGGPSSPIEDPAIIENYRVESSRETKPLQNQISKWRNEINQKIDAQTGVAQRKRAEIDAEIARLTQSIDEIEAASDLRIAERKEEFDQERKRLEKSRNESALSVEKQKEQIPVLRSEIVNIQEKIDTNKKIKREAAYESQIYRLAALAYGKNDVADVTTEQIKVVSVIWFGTVATIVATTGTVLALISFILQDPAAFAERKKISITNRIRTLIAIFFRKLNKVLQSVINVLIALTRLIISFAEIFRGIIGVPVQRSMRRAMLAYRKRLNKPRIEVVEKEVEKIVEVEIEKVVEVEKVVEKIVKVEVPVEKVVVQEVPVEIVRKELVYVPLYSTESGLIDASTQLKDAVPKLGGDHKEDDVTKQKTLQKPASPKKNQRKKQGS